MPQGLPIHADRKAFSSINSRLPPGDYDDRLVKRTGIVKLGFDLG
jgi:hypothetical protein